MLRRQQYAREASDEATGKRSHIIAAAALLCVTLSPCDRWPRGQSLSIAAAVVELAAAA
jgi:hypothetical protein